MSEEQERATSTDFMETMKVIKEFLVKKKVGNIQINCFKGGISSVTVNETLNWRKQNQNGN